jgi:very-short-patch-repair endonuclease
MLRSRLPPAVYDQRRILCGNPAQFQGDERDIIFLSLVDSKDDGVGPMSLRQDGADGMYKKRFNVASSRAKDQLWVVYSMDVQTQLKSTDIRRRLIEHAIDPSSLMDQLNSGLVKTESPFEAEVFKILSGHGYKVTPQWQVGAYRIDMVAEGNGKRLAIECDGERWHYDKADEDLARQALLERLGWTFVRIRGSVFYRDKTQGRQVALFPLFQRLKELGIEANHESNLPSSETEKHTLADTVKQKAAEIRSRATVPIGQTISIEAAVNAAEPISIEPQALVETSIQSKQIETPVQVPLFSPKVEQTSTNELKTPSQGTVQFVRGDRVFNQKFGLGTVVAIKQYGGQVRELVIDFDFLPDEKTLVVTAVQLA